MESMDEDESEDEPAKEEVIEPKSKQAKNGAKTAGKEKADASKKGAADNTKMSEDEGDEDESSDESSEEEVSPAKKEINAVQRAKKEAKLKADLKKEQEDMGKLMMTQRQRKLYQKAEQTRKDALDTSKKLREKKRTLTKKSAWIWPLQDSYLGSTNQRVNEVAGAFQKLCAFTRDRSWSELSFCKCLEPQNN